MSERPYLALLRALTAGGVHHAIVGGLAAVLHGVPRMTFDLDLAVDLAADNVSRLVHVLSAEGYRPRLPVPLADLEDANKRADWIAHRNLIAFSLNHPTRKMEEVDVLLAPGVSWDEIQASLVQRPINGDLVSVIGRDLLRRMKLATGREKDKADAELLGE
jgi:hypothetical protein